MNRKIFIPFLILLIIFSACSGNGASSNTISTPSGKSGDVNTEEGTRNLFETKCAACHGADGTAGIANAANLQTNKSDSTSIIQIMVNGKGAMPSFKDQLTEEQVHKLAHYVFTLRK